MTEGVTHTVGLRIHGMLAGVHIDRPPRVPFAITEFDNIVAALPYLQLVASKYLSSESPRLTPGKPGIFHWIDRILLQRCSRKPRTDILLFTSPRSCLQFLKWTSIVRRII